jgi:predicted component of type VI protein secretion system
MPVTANANVVDPTSCPGTPSHQRASLISAVLDVQPQAQEQASGDGLFTPADESTTVTPASIHCHVLDELARVFFGIPIVSSIPVEEFSPVLNAEHMSDLGLVIDDQAIEEIEAPVQLPPIGAEVMHISGAHPSEIIQAKTSRDGSISPLPPDRPTLMPATLTRKPTDPILVSDPYPYSLSTPGVDPTEEESEQDNSMSSNSTFEKDLEDKDTNSILDDADELELQYPESDILAELNGPATTKGEEASKFVDEVADVAHGDFDPESVVARLPQLSAEVQPANLPTIDNTVAPGPISDIFTELNGSAMTKGEEASKIIDEVADVAHGDFGPEFVVARLPQLSAEVQPANLPAIDSNVAPGPISDILAELNGSATAKGEESSKIVDEVADVAHGDFGPESVAARLPQLSTEVQPANLSTIDSTIAPGPINSVEKDDTPREIFPT